MLETDTITETEFGLPATVAFRIDGRVTAVEMKRMSERVLAAFDRHDRIDLVLIFDRFDGSEPGASLNLSSMKAQTASLWNVRAYVAVGAPESAGDMIRTMGRMLPVDAETFATEAEARAHLAGLPRLD